MTISLVFGASGAVGKLLKYELGAQGQGFVAVSRREGVSVTGATTAFENPNDFRSAEYGDVFLLASSLKVQTPPAEAAIRRSADYSEYVRLLSGIRFKRLVYFSSAGAVYGNGSIEDSFDENATLNPVSEYGRSKQELELLVKRVANTVSKRYLILRVANPMGCYGRDELFDYGLAVMLCRSIAGDSPATITVPMHYRKDYFSVRLLHEALHYFIADSQAAGVYNIGSGSTSSVAEVAEIVQAVAKRPLVLRHLVPSNTCDVACCGISTLKLQSLLEFPKPESLLESVREILSYVNRYEKVRD